MKKVLFLGLAVVLILAMPNCKKGGGGGGGGNNCSSEAAVSATTTPAINSTEPAAVGPDFPLTITLTNKPTAGVSIEVKARPDVASSTPFFNMTHATVTSNTDNFTITGTPATTAVIVEITVTSKSCSTNKWTGSYRYSRK
jgi:hypothetical protein